MKREVWIGLMKVCICFIVAVGAMFIALMFWYLMAIVAKNNALLSAFDSSISVSPAQESLGMLLVGVFQEGAMIFGTILLAKYGWKQGRDALGLVSLKKEWKDLCAGFALGFLGITVAFILLIVGGSVQIEEVDGKYASSIMLEFLMYILVGLGEEIFCRGGLMLALRDTHNKALIIGIPAVVFALLHLGNEGVSVLAIINLIGFGLFAGYCFYRSGNIWLAIGFHITWNFVQGAVYGFHVSGTSDYSLVRMEVVNDNLFTGGAFGPEGGLGVTIALVLSYLFVKYYYKNRRSAFEE